MRTRERADALLVLRDESQALSSDGPLLQAAEGESELMNFMRELKSAVYYIVKGEGAALTRCHGESHRGELQPATELVRDNAEGGKKSDREEKVPVRPVLCLVLLKAAETWVRSRSRRMGGLDVTTLTG